jgi:hypothetical protein
MDQPQRIRVRGDENVPPSFHANKAIHQRNKSTSALSLMAQNAKNGNAIISRRAFGDLSNAKPICDDSVLPGKPAVQVTNNKHALAQPAQRPLSMSGMKGVLNNVASKPVNPAGKAQATATQNNVKRTNVVFRDQLEPVVEKEPSKEGIITTQPARCDERLNAKEIARNIVDKDDDDEKQEYFDLPSEDSAIKEYISENSRQWSAMLPPQVEPTKPAPAVANVGKPRALHVEPLANAGIGSIEYRSQDATAPALSEVEDSEDEETRGHSFRTENTTGGTTTVIYPRSTAAIKHELLQAQSIVEANQTEEEIEEDFYDSSMVAEYSTEIFEHLRYKEVWFCVNQFSMDIQY